MKKRFGARWLAIAALVVVLFSQFPAPAAFADSGGSEFYGTVQVMPAAGFVGDWVVSTQTVRVSAATKIKQEHGTIAVGATVKVDGVRLADNSINAREIEVKSSSVSTGYHTEFLGTVQSLPVGSLVGDWQVSGKTVRVSASTKIRQERGAVVVGSFVKVDGAQQTDGSIAATEIEVRSTTPAPVSGSGKYTKYYGVVQGLPASGLIGDWLVSGLTVHVVTTTRIEHERGAPVIGTAVEIKGLLQADGSINATKIEVKSARSASAFSRFK